MGSQSFSYTGSVQSWTVPSGVTFITVTAAGAAGETSSELGVSAGGAGAQVVATIPVTPGDTLDVYVGGQFGEYGGADGAKGGGQGGDATSIVDATSSTLLLVAGGGGGGGDTYVGGAGGETGGAGHGVAGETAGGGTQSAAGAGGTISVYSAPSGSGPATAATPYGAGGAGDCISGSLACGGGGAGYYGGGGGIADGEDNGGGGGGGSSWVTSAATGVTYTSGANTGTGTVTITYYVAVSVTAPTAIVAAGAQPPTVGLGVSVTPPAAYATASAGAVKLNSVNLTAPTAYATAWAGGAGEGNVHNVDLAAPTAFAAADAYPASPTVDIVVTRPVPPGTYPPPTVAPDTWKAWHATRDANEATVADADARTNWPWLRILDGVGQLLQRVDDLARTSPEGDPGWSILLDPDRCPTYALPWLAQFVGVRFDRTQNTDAAQRAAIVAEQGFQRGTVAAIQTAVGKYLNDNATVTIVERTPDPYHYQIVISTTSLSGGTFNDSLQNWSTFADRTATKGTFDDDYLPLPDVTAAAAASKPGGLLVTVSTVDGSTFDQTEALWATFDDRLAAAPTFSDIALDG